MLYYSVKLNILYGFIYLPQLPQTQFPWHLWHLWHLFPNIPSFVLPAEEEHCRRLAFMGLSAAFLFLRVHSGVNQPEAINCFRIFSRALLIVLRTVASLAI